MATPLLETLKQLHYQVDLLLNPTWDGTRQLFEDDDRIGNIYMFPVLPAGQYDVVLETYWFSLFKLSLPFNTRRLIRLKPEFLNQHEIEYYMQYAVVEGYKGDIPPQRIVVNESERSFEKEQGKSTIGIHAGCFGGEWQKKQWPYFPELAKLLVKDFQVVAFGRENEKVEVDGVLNLTNLELKETVTNIGYCDCFVSNDSGLMHIANALNVPVVTLFGPTLCIKNRPLGDNALVIKSDIECAPCQYTKRFMECKENKCLSAIPAKFVYEEVKKHVNKWGKQTDGS